MGGFVHDDESGRLHHQPCGKSVRVSDDGPGAVDHYESTHVCEGHGWAGPARLVYRSPGRTGLTGPAPS